MVKIFLTLITSAVCLQAHAQVQGDIRNSRGDQRNGPVTPYNPPPRGQVGIACSPEETRQIAMDVERQTLDRVRQDIRAEGRASGSALGIDDQDCLRRATERAHYNRQIAIDQCTNQTTYFRSCEITQTRVTQPPMPLRPSVAQGSFDERNTDEMSCRRTAEQRAIQNALQQCQSEFNLPCQLIGAPTPASHQVERRRRYGIAGSKEDYHICHSTAQALPQSGHRVQCTVEIIAQVRL